MAEISNPFGQLDAQSIESHLAQVMPEEAIDHAPDPLHDAEAYSHEDDDGSSGPDDLADMNANEANDYWTE